MYKTLKIRCLTIVLIVLSISFAYANNNANLLPDERAYLASSDLTKALAEPYFLAYIARDWDALEALMHPHASWRDPTAEQLFGSEKVQGKAKTLAHLRKAFTGILQMEARVTRSMFSANYAVFESTLDWVAKAKGGNSVTIRATPFVVVLRVQDGKIVEHTDYASYHGFIAEFNKIRDGL